MQTDDQIGGHGQAQHQPLFLAILGDEGKP